MQKDQSFPLTLDYEGKHYRGMVIPSEELAKDGKPVYFRITLGGKLFAYLCCGDNVWTEKDSTDAPTGLIKAIGNYITNFYR